MTCNPGAIACQIELLRHSLDNPNEFQIWGFLVALLAAIGSILVAVVAARIALRSSRTAEKANLLAAEAQERDNVRRAEDRADAKARAEDEARRERKRFAKRVRSYLVTAAMERDGQTVPVSSKAQWIELYERAKGVRTANQSAFYVARSASRLIELIEVNEPVIFKPDAAQNKRISAMITPQIVTTFDWVADPETWVKDVWEPEAEKMRKDVAMAALLKRATEDERPGS